MKQLIEDCLEFLFRTVGGVFVLAMLIALIFLAIFWPPAERQPLPWLGIVGTDIDPKVIQQHRLPFSRGVLVERVFNNSPADYSNLVSGDCIVKFNNRIVFGEAQLRDLIFDMDPEEKAWMTVYRDGSYYNVMLRLATRPTDNAVPAQAAAGIAAAGRPTVTAAPPIRSDAILPHAYRGVCSNCHIIVNSSQWSQRNTQLVGAMHPQQNAQQFFPEAIGPRFGGVGANFGLPGNIVAQTTPPRMPAQFGAQRNLPGAVPATPLEEFTWVGISIETFNSANAAGLGLPPNVTGVQVDDVLRGSRGDRGGVLTRDVIREVNGVPVYDVDSFANLVTTQRLTGGVLLINRAGMSMYATVPEM